MSIWLSTAVESYRIHGLEGDDDINLTGGVNATGTFQVFGSGPGAGSDTLNLERHRRCAAQVVAIRPNAIESDDQDVQGFGSLLTATGIELITYTGADMNDRLNVELGGGDNVVRVSRGVGADQVTSNSLPKVEFAGLQFFQVVGQAGNDVVTFNTWFLSGAVNTNYEFNGGSDRHPGDRRRGWGPPRPAMMTSP